MLADVIKSEIIDTGLNSNFYVSGTVFFFAKSKQTVFSPGFIFNKESWFKLVKLL